MFQVTPSDIKNNQTVIAHGPIPASVMDDSLEGINPCAMYNVLLQVDLTPGRLELC